MPWCEPCETFYNPGSVDDGGTCPECGAPLEVGEVAHSHEAAVAAQQTHAKVPWHFWVGVAAMVLYLGWRLIQGIAWFF